jgi:hypothetical protein
MVVLLKRAALVFSLAVLGLLAGRIAVIVVASALPGSFYERHGLLVSVLEVPLLAAATAGVIVATRRLSRTARRLNPLLTGLLTTVGVLVGNWMETALSPAREDGSFLLPFAGFLLAVGAATHWARTRPIGRAADRRQGPRPDSFPPSERRTITG